jgi:hypothetical protein
MGQYGDGELKKVSHLLMIYICCCFFFLYPCCYFLNSFGTVLIPG